LRTAYLKIAKKANCLNHDFSDLDDSTDYPSCYSTFFHQGNQANHKNHGSDKNKKALPFGRALYIV
jgi:hypothetical protein